MKTEAYQNQIDEIMDNFDFDRVQKMMAATDWTWHTDEGSRMPSQPELREVARSCLRTVAERECFLVGTGGFTAINREGCLSLYWGVSWECEPQESAE